MYVCVCVTLNACVYVRVGGEANCKQMEMHQGSQKLS